MIPAIEVTGLNRSFNEVRVVSDLNLSIAPGEIYGLVGSDGAGKTTTLRLLVGALKPDSGSVSICGFPLDRQGEQTRSCVGYLSQRFSLYEDLTVLENIRFFAELRGISSATWQPRCMEILEFVGLSSFKDRHAGYLSGGMKQKLGLASALVTQPQVLLLDEPTTGVDPVTRQDFWHLITRLVAGADSQQESHRHGKRCVLLTTPYMDEASRCNRVGFMCAGRIIAEGTPLELRSLLKDRIFEIRGDGLHALRETMRHMENIEDIRHFGDKLHIRLARSEKMTRFPGLENCQVRQIPATLEDVFIYLSSLKDDPWH